MAANVWIKDITREMVRELGGYLTYNPDTGSLVWPLDRGPCLAGSEAGTRTKNGYVIVQTPIGFFMSHRLVYALYYGELSGKFCIDHIDRDKGNNRINNLRQVSHATNMQNQDKPRSDNSTGFRGVFAQKSKNGSIRYYARMQINGISLSVKGGRSSAKEAYDALVDLKRDTIDGVLYNAIPDIVLKDRATYDPIPPKPVARMAASGTCGVYHRKDSGKWLARIMRSSILYALGSTYADFEEAYAARIEAEAWWRNHGTMYGLPWARPLYLKRGNTRTKIDHTEQEDKECTPYP